MKKNILLIFILGSVFSGMSQFSSNAIGARLGGGNFGNGAEISYQKGLGDHNRLELDLGFYNSRNVNALGLFAGYHWGWNITSGLNWYVGPGASFYMYNRKNASDYNGIAIGGQLGLEYNFEGDGIPLLLSLDIRPMWDLWGDVRNGWGYGAALGVRYVF